MKFLPKDRSDIFSPILIKEINQGMRTKTFVGAFIITQGVMFFAILAMLLASDDGGFRQSENTTFWMIIGAPFILLMPLRGLDAVNAEIRDNTMDMLYLSRLSSIGIVFGKYMSHLIQILLLAVSMLPYLMLRYFAGGVNIVNDLFIFFIILLVSSLVLALTVAVSSFATRNKVSSGLRIFLFFMLGYMLFMGLATAMSGMFRHGGFSTSSFFKTSDLVLICCQLPFIIYQLLLFGATQIAPPSERILIRKRLSTLAIFVIYLIGHLFSEHFITLGALVFSLALSGIEALFCKECFLKAPNRIMRKIRLIRLAFTPNFVGGALWFHYCFMMLAGLIILESLKANSQPVDNIHILGFAAALTLIFAVKFMVSLNAFGAYLSSLATHFYIPVICFSLMFYSVNHSSWEAVAGISAFMFSLYACIIVPYAFTRLVLRKLKLAERINFFAAGYIAFLLLWLVHILIAESTRMNIAPSTAFLPQEGFLIAYSLGRYDNQFLNIFNFKWIAVEVFIAIIIQAGLLARSFRAYKRVHERIELDDKEPAQQENSFNAELEPAKVE